MAATAAKNWKNSEREFLVDDNTFRKRSLRPDEYIVNIKGDLFVPRQGYERLQNEAAYIRFIRENTEIPVPEVLQVYDDKGAFVLTTRRLHGIEMRELSAEQQSVVMGQVESHLHTLRSLRGVYIGGPTGIVCPPPRVTRWFPEGTRWTSTAPGPEGPDLVFCHGDLSQSNILVDPKTLKIEAIIDWEFAGFWPEDFEAPYFRDPSPSGAQFTQRASNAQLIAFMESQGHKLDN
ncbi:hypothetical protein MCOR14_011984 [Pyricularia oryzae]|nr:hypothetical protein MCOR14_011984 [Pyricularia oryzae]